MANMGMYLIDLELDLSGSESANKGAAPDASEVVKVETPQESTTRASAKRRRLSAKCSDESVGTVVKKSDAGSSKGETPEFTSPGGRGKGGRREKQPCPGCQRSQGVSLDFLLAGETVTWLGNGKGAWCKDCHTLWRTVYEKHHALSYFAAHLGDNAQTQKEFTENLTAYVSLKHEGVERIAESHINARVKMLRWLFQAVCSNPVNNAVVPLAEAVNGPHREHAMQPANLCTLITGGIKSLGVRVPLDLQPGVQGVIARTWPDDAVVPFQAHALVASDLPEDASALASLLGVSPDVLAIAAKQVKDEEVEPSPRAARSRIEKRLFALSTSSNQVVDKLCGPEWDKVTEAMFTKPAQAAATLQVECGQVGEEQRVHDKACELASGLTAAKTFLKAHRDYVKSNHKVNRLKDMGASLKEFIRFAISTGRSVSKTLHRLSLKISFYEIGKNFSSLAKALGAVTEQGLEDCLHDEAAQGGTTPEVWFRTLVQDHVVDYIEQVQLDSAPDQVPALSNDFKAAAKIIAGMKDDVVRGCIAPSREDLLAIATTLDVFSDCATAADLDMAEPRLTAKRLARVKQAFVDADFGRIALSKMSTLLQLSGQDQLADQKLAYVQKMMQDDRLLTICDVDGSPAFKGVATLEDLACLPPLEEAFSGLVEAVSLWSPRRMGQRAEQAREVLVGIVSAMCLCSEALAIRWFALIETSDAWALIKQNKPESCAWVDKDSVKKFTELGERLTEYAIDDQDLLALGERVSEWLQGVAPETLSQEDAREISQQFCNPLEENSYARERVTGVLELMSDILSKPDMTGDALMAEFAELAKGGTPSGGTLGKAVRLPGAVHELSNATFHFDHISSSVSMSLKFPKAGTDYTMTPQWPREVVAAIHGCNALNVISAVVSESAQQVFAQFVKDSCIGCIGTPDTQLPAEDASQLLDALVTRTDEACKAATAAFASRVPTPNGRWIPRGKWLRLSFRPFAGTGSPSESPASPPTVRKTSRRRTSRACSWSSASWPTLARLGRVWRG